MKFRKLYFVFILITTSVVVGQNKGNSHFFKLLVFNKSQEVLLIKFDGSWEIPGARYDTNTTIPEFIAGMAKDHGIAIKNLKLAALATFHHEVRDYPTMMFYYRATHFSGNLKNPSWGQEVKWFSLDDAYKLIPYQEMNYIIKTIVSEKRILTGAFKIIYDKNTLMRTGQFQIMEDFN